MLISDEYTLRKLQKLLVGGGGSIEVTSVKNISDTVVTGMGGRGGGGGGDNQETI